jgi:hypothetical protein
MHWNVNVDHKFLLKLHIMMSTLKTSRPLTASLFPVSNSFDSERHSQWTGLDFDSSNVYSSLKSITKSMAINGIARSSSNECTVITWTV